MEINDFYYQKIFEEIGKALEKQSKMIVWLAERTLSVQEYLELVNEFKDEKEVKKK